MVESQGLRGSQVQAGEHMKNEKSALKQTDPVEQQHSGDPNSDRSKDDVVLSDHKSNQEKDDYKAGEIDPMGVEIEMEDEHLNTQ